MKNLDLNNARNIDLGFDRDDFSNFSFGNLFKKRHTKLGGQTPTLGSPVLPTSVGGGGGTPTLGGSVLPTSVGGGEECPLEMKNKINKLMAQFTIYRRTNNQGGMNAVLDELSSIRREYPQC